MNRPRLAPRAVLMLALACTVTFGILGPAGTEAGTQSQAVILLHAGPHSQKGDSPCDYADGGAPFPCHEFTTNWPLGVTANLYLVVARGFYPPGIAAMTCGISYNHGATGPSTALDGTGVDVYAFTTCGSSLQPCEGPCPPCCGSLYPGSGSGLRILWDPVLDCQSTVVNGDGVHALAGSFYVYAYSDDRFEITPARSAEAPAEVFQVGDCDLQVTELSYPDAAGAVAFGSGSGRNPCLAVPVRPTSWSRLKTTYK